MKSPKKWIQTNLQGRKRQSLPTLLKVRVALPRLASNCGEFAVIKIRVVDGFPDSQKLDGVTVPEPIRNKEFSILRLQHVSKRNIVRIIL